MGWNCIRHRTDEEIISKQIDKELKTFTEEFESAIKVLLLGTGESGKSTITKQMKILHINGYSLEERKQKISEIRQNIHESMYVLVSQLPNLGLECDSIQNSRSAKFILQLGEIPNFQVFDADYYNHIKALWMDSNIRECYRRSNEFQLIDSAKFFLSKVEDIEQSSYIPSTTDILHSRKITTGIHEISFKVGVPKGMRGGDVQFRMFDVGGQRDQRKKWLQVCEGIQAVLFIISCADFDQTLREDVTENRLTESIKLFSLVFHNQFLLSAGLICFLNKQDILEEKIRMGKSIGNYFPKYDQFRVNSKDGNVFDEIVKTRCFIRQQLIDITKQPPPKNQPTNPREVFYHFTVATDTNNIQTVFNDIHYLILTNILGNHGLN